MAASNNRESALQKDMFYAFDEIVLDVQRLEREIYSEQSLCEKLNGRLKELDAEEIKVLEQTNNLFAKREENFKKEVDVQAALDCITKTLQLEKERHAGLRHQLDRANSKAVEQNLRLAAKEEKYGALWNSYKAVYESFPLVTEVNRMTDLVKHDKIKLMQTNFALREAHNQIVQMRKISELAKKVEMVKLAEVFSEHAASERRVVEMQRQMSQLQASVGRGMERKQQLLARPTAKPAAELAQATLPATQVAAFPVASCTGQASENYASLLNLRSLPQVPLLATAYSRQASLEIVRARYAKQSWPRDNGSSFPTDESQPNVSVPSATAASTAPQAMDCSLLNSQTPSLPSDMEYSSQAKSCGVPMQVECSSQVHLETLEVAMEISDGGSQIPELPVSMVHSTQGSQPGNIPMDQNEIERLSEVRSPTEVATQVNEVAGSSQGQSQPNQVQIHKSGLALSYQELLLDTDISMPAAAPELQTAKVFPAKLTIETGGSTLPITNCGGTGISSEERPITAGMPLRESMAEISLQSFEWSMSALTPGTALREQEPTPGMSASQSGVPDGASGNDPEQAAEGDDDMDGAPSLSQVSLIGSQEELSCTQRSNSGRTSRVEYLKKLRQSPEFHYATRFMYNRQEVGTQEIGSASPYFQPLVSEANAHRHQAEPLLRGNEHPKDLQAQPNQHMQSHQQNEQFPSRPVPNQLPSQQVQMDKMQGHQTQSQQFPRQTLQGQQLPVLQFSNQTPLYQQSQARQSSSQTLQSQPSQVQQSPSQNLQGNQGLGNQGLGQQLPNQKSLDQQVMAQQFDHWAMGPPTDQESRFRTYKEGLVEMQHPGGQHPVADAIRTSQLNEPRNHNDSPAGSQDRGISQPTGQFGSQDNGIHAQTTSQFGSQNADNAQTTFRHESQNSANAQTSYQCGSQKNDCDTPITTPFGNQNNANSQVVENQFGSQNNSNPQAIVNQFGSQSNENAQSTGQFVQQNITSPPSGQTISEDNVRYNHKQVLSQSNDFFYTPRQSQGDGVRMEMGDGDFESPLSAFPSPGEALTSGNKGPAAPDTHDSSSNESFQYKSPCCSPPPTESTGFSFMGSAPPQQTSLFGAPGDPQNGGGDAQQKPRSEAFNFNFSSNSSKPIDVDLELGTLASSKSSALLIGPLVAIVQDFTNPTLDNAEDFLLATLRAHRGLNGKFVTSFLLYSLPHMAIGYLLLLAAVIAFFGCLCAMCRNFCSKSHGKANCGELCFFFGGLLFVIASAFLLLGVVSQLQTAVRVDSALQLLPAQGSSALAALVTLRANLHLRVEELRQDHSQALEFVTRSVADLPAETTMLATKVMGPLANQSHHLASEIRRHLQTDINATGVMLRAGAVLSNATAATNSVNAMLSLLAQRVRNDVQLPAQSRHSLASAIDTAREAALVELIVPGMPDWHNESAAMAVALDALLPAITASVHFERDAPAALLGRLESRVLTELREAAHNAGVDANETANRVAAASEELLPQWLLDELATRLEAWQWVVASLDVGRTSEGSASFSGRALLVLCPGVHGIATLLVAAAAAAVSVVEIRRHRAVQAPLLDCTGRSLGARLLWTCGMFAASLLWLHLLLAGGVQLLSHVSSTVCRPLLNQRIFRDLLDNPQVWGGTTYLDMKIPEHVCRDNSTNGTRVRDVLDRCRRRQNLLDSLGFDLGPALSEELKRLCPDVNSSLLEHALDEGLHAVEWLSGNQVGRMRTLLQQTHDAINLTVIAQVESTAVNLTAANVTGRLLRPLLLALPRDPSYDYIQEEVHRVINDVTRLEVVLLPNLQAVLRNLAELRRALDVAMQGLRSLSAFASGMSGRLQSDLRAHTRALAKTCATQANQRMRDWRRSVAPGIGEGLGSCHAVYDAYVTITRGVCGEGLALTNAVWVTHSLMAVALMAIMVLSCNLGVCLRGARVRYLRMRLLLQSKVSEQAMQEALSKTSTLEILPARVANELTLSTE